MPTTLETLPAPPRDAAREPDPATRELRALLAGATAVGALGAWICFDALPGANWGIWTTTAALGLALSTRRARGRVPVGVGVPLALASLLSLSAAITANGVMQALVLVSCIVLLAVAMLVAAGASVERVGLAFLAVAPVSAIARVTGESIARLFDALRLGREGRTTPLVRGLVFAAPVVGLFALLLSGADPTMARWRDGALRMLGDLAVIPRVVFFVALSGLVLGAYGSVLRRRPPEVVVPVEPQGRLGTTERTIVLGSVIALFLLFFGLQLSYLWGDVARVAGSGITYAEAARRGFAELTIVATLATVLVVGLDRYALPDAGERRVQVLSIVLVVLVQCLLDSAFRRVTRYEEAYGFTTARLYAQVYMLVVSVALVAVASEIWCGIDVRRLVRVSALAAAAALLGLAWWNHEAWIARRNIERFVTTGKIDAVYLATELSPDAVPTVVAAAPAIAIRDVATAVRLRDCVRWRYGDDRTLVRESRWFEWNRRRSAAARALREQAMLGPHPSARQSCFGSD